MVREAGADVQVITECRIGPCSRCLGADLSGANPAGTDLSGVNLTSARFCDTTIPDARVRNDHCGDGDDVGDD